MRCRLVIEMKKWGSVVQRTFEGCLGFTFEKDIYMPYTKFSGMFYEDGKADLTAGQVLSVRVFLDDREIHYGMPDKVSIVSCGYGYRIQVDSRGYTLLLLQNEPYPKVNTNVTLKSLCTKNLDCSRISYEDPTPKVNNIYVKEGSNVWEAAVAYCIKANGNYPYIRETNLVSMTMNTAKNVEYADCVITEQTSSADSSMILSDIYMKELGDDYPFEAHDRSAADMGIVRSRYYPLDMQWLYDPQAGLQHKLDYSNRSTKVFGMTYEGWKKEDLMDKIYCRGDMLGMRINHIKIVGSRKGVFTTVRAYDDRYGQR